jgi:DNA invertase Pin-like site-specific DNA recombinase
MPSHKNKRYWVIEITKGFGARNTFDLFAILKQIGDAKAQFRSLAEPWADTGTSTRRLMLAVLGGLADVERDPIRARTSEGRERAKARGIKLGRKPKLTEHQKCEAIRLPRPRRRAGARHCSQLQRLT